MRLTSPGIAAPALLALALFTGETDSAQRLTFEDRVRAQEAIESVYFSHLEGARRTFEQAVTPELLERKVRTYLKQSDALARHWNTPITADALAREAARIARDTRFPERLWEIDAALGHDPVLFQETFVRATLAERLTRSFFAFDEPTHQMARAEAEQIHAQLLDGTLDPRVDHPRRILEPADESPFPTSDSMDEPFGSSMHETPIPQGSTIAETQPTLRRPHPGATGVIGPVEESAGVFSIRIPSSEPETPGVIYRVPKTTWDDWWASNQESWDHENVHVVAHPVDGLIADHLAPGDCPPDDVWDNGALDDRPDGRFDHRAVWTGTEMIVWGGLSTLGPASNGGRYDPLTDSWRSISLIGAPERFSQNTAVWTGAEMIVWGFWVEQPLAGARYDPVSDTWRPVSSLNEPLRRTGHSAIWTGTEMIIWGGVEHPIGHPGGLTSTGGRYNPELDSWLPLSLTNAPTSRSDHTAVWTGTEMIVWGGTGDLSVSGSFLLTGGRYDPSMDSWSSTTETNAPAARSEHSAIWTGTEMIVWGGLTLDGFFRVTSTGGRYDPSSDSWTSTPSAGVPAARRAHTAVWTGSRMIVWGGSRHSNPNNSFSDVLAVSGGAAYDPLLIGWQDLSATNTPPSVAYHSAVWTGSLMVVWGGTRGGGLVTGTARGGRYDPGTDSWTPTSTALDGVQVSINGAVVWTGTEMIVWSFGGGRYDPLIDSWRGISTVNAPPDRFDHAAVWTGDEMVIVGGGSQPPPLGGRLPDGRYDPILDTWRTVSTMNSPDVRNGAKAVWTGREVLVWGGKGAFFPSERPVGTGGRYDPSTDTWRLLPDVFSNFDPSVPSAPSATSGHTAIWTGTEMIVLGGTVPNVGPTSYGASYNPDYDLWTSLPSIALGPRSGHTAVWTGTEMLVLGGALGFPNWFWSYSPSSNEWTFLPSDQEFVDRRAHAAVWTGRHMLVWGGTQFPAIYDHGTVSWSRMSTLGQPLTRLSPQAVWTGTFMLVWGGSFGEIQATGGRYRFGQNTDDDGDLLSECDGDCDDADAGIWPGAAERCNGRDDSCDGAIDEDGDGLDSDGDGSPNACDVCPQFSNPGQSDPFACVAIGEDDGECVAGGIVLATDIDEGAVTIVREVQAVPEAIHVDLLVTSCQQTNPIEVLLNGQSLFTFVDPDLACDCLSFPYRVTVSDSALIHDLWNTTGENVFQLRKPASNSIIGTVFGWMRVHIGSAMSQKLICLFDANDLGCSHSICENGVLYFTSDALDESLPVSVLLFGEETLLSEPFTDSILPEAIDIAAVPDGALKLCVGPSDPPRLYAADGGGSLHALDHNTAVSTMVGTLETGILELAHDELSRRTFVQTTTDPRSLQQVDVVGMELLSTSPFLGPPLHGMQFFDGRLYGFGDSRFLEIAPDTGSSRKVSEFGGIGLAYETGSAFFYSAGGTDTDPVLLGVDVGTGKNRILQTLEFRPTALEVGPDGSLYATKGLATDTELYRIDASTGGATLVGSLGIPDVTSLATVRNHPRACIDFVKQGEQTLSTNGSCNAPPSASAGADLVAECTSSDGTPVTLDGSASTDPDASAGTNDDIVLFEWFEDAGTPSERLLGAGEMLGVVLPLGPHDITLRVTDRAGAVGSDAMLLTVTDITPPTVIASLVPTGHAMEPGTVSSRGRGRHGDDDEDGGGHGDDDDDGHGDDDNDDGGHGDDDDDGHGDDDDDGQPGGDDDDDGGHGDDDDDGHEGRHRFVVRFSASDTCDSMPVSSGQLLIPGCVTVPVDQDQVIAFERENGECEVKIKDGVLKIEGSSIGLQVTARDASGNTQSVVVSPPAILGAERDASGRPLPPIAPAPERPTDNRRRHLNPIKPH